MISSRRVFTFLVIAAAVGVPGLLQFDRSGLTHDYGLFNIQSYLRIALYLTIAILFFFFLLVRRQPQNKRLADYFCGTKLLLALYGVFLVSAVGLSSVNDILLVVYRVGEWLIVIMLVSVAIEDAQEFDFIYLIRAICLVLALTVIVGVIVAPSHAIFMDASYFRLGGWLYYPNMLGIMCGIGSVAFLGNDRPGAPFNLRWQSVLAASILFVMIILTFSRGALVGFVVGLLPFVYFSDMRVLIFRLICVSLLCLAVGMVAYSSINFFIAVAGRGSGGGLDNIVTLSARTYVWRASWLAFAESPWVGHGFIVGPKLLGTYMDQPWWSAPNAHNDFLNAAVGGGLPAALITLLIYITTGWQCLRFRSDNADKRVIISIFIQGAVYGLVTPLLSSTAFPISIIFVCLIRYVALANADASRRMTLQRSIKPTAGAPAGWFRSERSTAPFSAPRSRPANRHSSD